MFTYSANDHVLNFFQYFSCGKLSLGFLCNPVVRRHKTSLWELMEPRTKNGSDKTQDIPMPYVGNGYV